MSPSIRTHKVRSSLLRKLAALTLLASAPSIASAQTPVVYGDTITEPGLYFLAGNQTGSGSHGITIDSDDVILLLGRFTLRGDRTNVGIITIEHDNVAIYGGRVTEFTNGILFIGGEHCTVKDTRIDHCSVSGLQAIETHESWFSRLRCDHNDRNGVDARECDGSRFVSILAHDNERHGIFISVNLGFAGGSSGEEDGVKVRLCWAAYNKLDGIRVQNTNRHEIVSNQCVQNGEAGIHLDSTLDDPKLGAVALDGPSDNLVKSNWCVFNHDGIVVDALAHDNTLTNNTALANFHRDAIDDNPAPPCENLWFLNTFLTRDGASAGCIF